MALRLQCQVSLLLYSITNGHSVDRTSKSVLHVLSGSAIISSVFCFLHFVFPAHEVKEFLARSAPPGFLMNEYQNRWDGEISKAVESDINEAGIVTDSEVPHF